MPNPRPNPPRLDTVMSEADEVTRQLLALGIDDARTVDQLVYQALVDGWKANHAQPVLASIAKQLGVTGSSVDGALNRLLEAGRVLHPRRGVWVPVVV